MRLFTGIALAENVIDKLSETLNELRPAVRINWSPIENLHITCKFIGAWPDDRLSDIDSALATVPAAGPVPMSVSRFGFFPNPHHPHSFFASVQSGPKLAELATAIDRALAPLGLAAETRPYHPHVTVARIKPNSDIKSLRERTADMTDFDFGTFEAKEFHLYLSQSAANSGRPGSVYTKLATYDLMREQKTTS